MAGVTTSSPAKPDFQIKLSWDEARALRLILGNTTDADYRGLPTLNDLYDGLVDNLGDVL